MSYEWGLFHKSVRHTKGYQNGKMLPRCHANTRIRSLFTQHCRTFHFEYSDGNTTSVTTSPNLVPVTSYQYTLSLTHTTPSLA